MKSHSEYVLYRVRDGIREPIGFFDTSVEAACAMDEERKKEDGIQLEIGSIQGGNNE